MSTLAKTGQTFFLWGGAQSNGCPGAILLGTISFGSSFTAGGILPGGGRGNFTGRQLYRGNFTGGAVDWGGGAICVKCGHSEHIISLSAQQGESFLKVIFGNQLKQNLKVS